ncbi:uncharacterized protein LOC105254410 isoform X1 [Camponotus floridanus]|uniref:uncharacterized protein LOC105254410 isoform X1 n=1 Tax=Camponotus floridanus TaxID=104421 RepID=UPI000DC69780|nr:uncharacterized protein LOC105254410 isoform X1 [Camponotus floridanus]
MKKLLPFKWAKKTARSERGVQSALQGSNEYYRNLLQQFTSSCHTPNGDINDPGWIIYRPKEQNANQSSKKGNEKSQEQSQFISGVPHIQTSEIFEIGNMVGTESQFLELVSAEWHNMKVTLKRSIFPSCQDAIKREVEVLREIRHPNILLLMGTTHTITQEIVSIFESVDCTLYNYIHERGERLNTQVIMQVGMKLADILKYCHMRGYIHTAVSSRCVYFTSNNNVKLGGWEMAVEMGISYQFREYEKYLRLENLKWEPPGICYGEYHNKKVDIYGLMLLLWEMCTGCVPRNGYNRNVERHFMIRKHDIMVSLQNVPPILHDLLETGLHPDETKMTLDMDKIGRRLHRLLMICEEEEKNNVYMSKCEGNNNNDLLYDDNNALRKKTFSVFPIQNKTLNKKPIAKSHCPMIETKPSSNQFLKFKKKYNEDLDSKNNVKNTDEFVDDSIVSSMIKVTASTPCTRCSEISNMMYNMDEVNDARANIKRLKELIASKREDFFFGNDSMLSSYSNPKATSTLLSEERSPNCITCKPANHTITLEPKCNKSPNEYNGTTPKSSYMFQRKTPYPSMPASIKHAIIQPRVLHSDAKSFYESTLWRKEKEICLSRMARDSEEQTEDLSLLQQSNYNDTPITDDDKAQYSKTDLTNTDATYTVEFKEKGDYTKDNKESPLNVESDYPSTKVPTFSNKSIQNLKDALDRATEIVHLVTPSKIHNPELDWTNKQELKTVFNLYETTYDNNQNITVKEKWTPSNSNFLEIDNIKNTGNNIEAAIRHEEIFNQAFIKNETFSSTNTKTSNESQISTRERQSTNLQNTDQNNVAITNKIISNPQQTKVDSTNTHEMKYVNVDTITNSIIIKDSPRRRSLPARLNTLIMSIPKITCQRNMPSSQYLTEDIYIDDEFGSRLNYNLVLLDDELHLLNTALSDNESLPQTTEL